MALKTKDIIFKIFQTKELWIFGALGGTILRLVDSVSI
jgi:hypothetical protein